MACQWGVGRVFNADDCDDTNAAVNPDEPEVCDGADNDCDGMVDDDDTLSAQTGNPGYPDMDGDGYGNMNLGHYYCVVPSNLIAMGVTAMTPTPPLTPPKRGLV